jgi:5'-3' exonuclease
MDLAAKFKKFTAEKLSGTQPINDALTDKVMIIDGLNAYIRAFAATPTMNDNGDHYGGVTGFLLSVGYAIRTFKPSKVFVVFDGRNGSKRRKELFPNYKAGRQYMTKLNRTYEFKTIEDEIESRQKQQQLLMGMLMCLPVVVNQRDYVEADDEIAELAHIAEARGNKVIIMSNDKDFLQLVNENISVWNPPKKKMYNPDRVLEDYGFHPNNFLLYRAVTGDKSDCIPGVEGIKEKTLLKHFPELAEPIKRDIDFLLEGAQAQIDEKKKPPVVLTTLVNSRAQLELNMKLMSLADVSMSGYNKGDVIKIFDREPNEYNKSELTKHIRFNKLIGAFGNYESWLLSTFHPLTRYKLNKD